MKSLADRAAPFYWFPLALDGWSLKLVETETETETIKRQKVELEGGHAICNGRAQEIKRLKS
jgi:hypothetical protein